jgi:hypothetical protein
MHSNIRLIVLSKARTKAQAGCYAGGTTPRQSGPRPCMPGLDVTFQTCKTSGVIVTKIWPSHHIYCKAFMIRSNIMGVN